MNPGRELDALIAEKLFGLHLKDRFTGKTQPITSGIALQRMDLWQGIPYYSTDIAAAWSVVDKLNLLSNQFMWRNGEGKYAIGDTNGVNDCLEHVIGETAPHAICLAALKSVGVEGV